ncbi:hypothetical protein P175DRAFT_0513199 [Aspergillus ochraceoroseus IBT 24754]|uniref:Fumarylacetoacetase n=1 Tax=Aspergillus ochraceoroseus IBT 24754 TaxID=1392256 RepID=A0A2T5M6N1_9EURO|nr:uncharacterized protein P175DRAFT_0513199 [Aspergillus ochraceoroseus IBT 24754]PTU24166.1 hypothetical protein P175DRAFT_0513199 [Aspergillus ochraceoroseus IBT 24754]
MASTTPFPIDNLPYGVISTVSDPTPRCATALENDAIDLSALERDGFFCSVPGFEDAVFSQPTLNAFAALPKSTRAQVRDLLTKHLADLDTRKKYAVPLSTVENHFPMETKNFSDFYCSLEHTQNCTEISNRAIPENWFYVPSVYNGRTSSLRVSGTPVRRPWGVFRESPSSQPIFSPTRRFDFELEMGVFLSKPLPPGEILDIQNASEYIFGLVILNDWSARDIQMFEMPPLGPFHGKGSGTTISPWIVTLEALSGSLCASTKVQDPAPLHHLTWKGAIDEATFDIELEAKLLRNGKAYVITETNLNELYWTPYQQLAHLTSAGEGLSVGDIFGTGTITSARTNSDGENTGIACLFERTMPRNALASTKADGIVYLDDGDEVIMEGWCMNRHTGRRFGFGQCSGVVVPAKENAA